MLLDFSSDAQYQNGIHREFPYTLSAMGLVSYPDPTDVSSIILYYAIMLTSVGSGYETMMGRLPNSATGLYPLNRGDVWLLRRRSQQMPRPEIIYRLSLPRHGSPCTRTACPKSSAESGLYGRLSIALVRPMLGLYWLGRRHFGNIDFICVLGR